ncbi:hypothetical protein ACMFMF_003633 [Clarireedia jacksonii]
MCVGWKIQYEIFDIQGQAQCKVCILLDAEEVCLLLRQSLRNSNGRWSLTFPVSISKDLSIIIVLRTVFKFDLGTIKDPVPYRSIVVPLQTSNWSPTQPYFTYAFSYDWLISFDSKYIVYQSFDRGLNPDPQRIRIFRITTQTDFGIHDVCTVHLPGVDPAYLVLCVLHPQRPFLIFAANEAIWGAYLERGGEVIKLIDTERGRFARSGFVEEIGGGPEGIGFSACRFFFTVQYPFEWPRIYPLRLPEHLHGGAVETSVPEVAIGDAFNNRKWKTMICAHEPDDPSALSIAKIPKIMSAESMVVGQQKSLSDGRDSILLSHMPMPQSIDLIVQSGNSGATTLSLAKFPNQIDISHTKSTVLWPSNQSGSLQVILTQPPKMSYSSDEINASPFLPAVLSRDPQSIAPPRSFRNAARYINPRLQLEKVKTITLLRELGV